MRAGITVKAGKGLKIVGTPDRKSPIEAGINNPNAVSNITTVPGRSTFTGTLLKLHHIADHEDGIIGENRKFPSRTQIAICFSLCIQVDL
jgi:hypothetical protein